VRNVYQTFTVEKRVKRGQKETNETALGGRPATGKKGSENKGEYLGGCCKPGKKKELETSEGVCGRKKV